eukprot:583544_1
MGNNNNIISDSSDDLFEEEDDSMNDPLEYDIEPSESLEIYSAQMNGKKKIKTGTKLSVKNELNHLNGIWKGTNYDMIAFYSILVIVILNVIVFSYCLCIKGKKKLITAIITKQTIPQPKTNEKNKYTRRYKQKTNTTRATTA